ncbi:MAG TPA: hypothetical protein DIT01_19155 [Lentisphaeria bacterium]|nr:hypothetical protein [Lentisphaeria bacterium]|tara:strand:+ start:298 stop:1548 length:1251 start_codon:yes stop_codon:yes gene_type:complete
MDSRARTIIIMAVLLLAIPLVLLLQRGGDETAAASTPVSKTTSSRQTSDRLPTPSGQADVSRPARQPNRVHGGVVDRRSTVARSELIQSLRDADEPERSRIFDAIAEEFEIADLDTASNVYRRLSGIDDRVEFVRRVLAQIIESNPQAALDWIDAIASRGIRPKLYGAFAAEWSEIDVAGALKWAEQLSYDQHRTQVMGGIAETWAKADHEAAAAWAAALPGQDQRMVVDSIVAGWFADEWKRVDSSDIVEFDMADAYEWAAQLPDSLAQKKALVAVAKSWAYEDPAAAAAWAAQFPPGQTRTNAMIHAASTWTALDPAASSVWFNELPPTDKSTITAFFSVASSWSLKEPEKAAEWVATMIDEGLQDTGFRMVFRQWARQDRAAAARWIEQSDMSDDRQTKFLDQLDQSALLNRR